MENLIKRSPTRITSASYLIAVLVLLIVPALCQASNYPDKLHILSLLEKRKYRSLDRLLMTIQQNSENDVSREVEVQLAFEAFTIPGTEVEPLLRDWVKQAPKSYPAHLATAKYFEKLGWRKRGGKWAHETSENQLRAMNAAFSRASHSATTALSLRPAAIEAYVTLMNIAMANGEEERERALAEEALKKIPESFRIRRAHMQALLPRWGGSYEAMEKFADQSQAYASKNPKLRRLKGMVAWDRGVIATSEKDYRSGIQLFTEALRAGEYAEFYAGRADAHVRMKQYDNALTDASSSLDLYPQDPSVLADRALSLIMLDRIEEAKKNIELISRIDSGDESLKMLRQWFAQKLNAKGWELHKRGDALAAINRFTEAAKMDPTYPDTFYWRALMYAHEKNLDLAQADFEEAIRLNPRYLEAYQQLDLVLVQRKRWNELIFHWSKLLELEPSIADAYLGRARAFHYKGNEIAALEDLRKACSLGSKKACELYDHEKKNKKPS